MRSDRPTSKRTPSRCDHDKVTLHYYTQVLAFEGLRLLTSEHRISSGTRLRLHPVQLCASIQAVGVPSEILSDDRVLVRFAFPEAHLEVHTQWLGCNSIVSSLMLAGSALSEAVQIVHLEVDRSKQCVDFSLCSRRVRSLLQSNRLCIIHIILW